MAGLKEVACKACGQMILFVRMSSGKQMPIDAKVSSLVEVLELRGTTKPMGRMVKGHVPHWATCSDAQRFKAKHETKEANDDN